MTILIAEDAPVDAIILRNIIVHAGHAAVVVGDGSKALAVLEERPEVVLVLADVHMPGMDGVALTRAMRERPLLSDIPVVFVSGASDAQTVQEAISLHPAGYLLKPVNEPSRVLDLVSQALGRVVPFLTCEDGERRHTAERIELAAALRALLEGGAARESDRPTLESVAELAGVSGAPRIVGAMREGAARADDPALQRTLRATLNVLEACGY